MTDTQADAARERVDIAIPLFTRGLTREEYRERFPKQAVEVSDALDAYGAMMRLEGEIAALREAADRFCPEGTVLRETCGAEATFNERGRPVVKLRPTCGSHLMLDDAEARLAELEVRE